MNTKNKVVPMHDNPLLSAALGYASLGWHVFPCWWIKDDGQCACGSAQCKSPGKHPISKLAPWGQNNATIDAEPIKSWWTQYPQANIAVFLEKSSLCAIDIDPRNGGLDTIDQIEAKHGALESDLLQFTGGGGEHRVFAKPLSGNLPGKLGPGVDVKANGYIMLEPSNHASGKQYVWEASSDPRDGIMASPLPDWLRDLSMQHVTAAPVQGPAEGRVLLITEAQKREIAQALQAIPSDDRDTWLQVGMALQSTDDPQWAFETWSQWSQQSPKFDPVDQLRVWRSIKAKGLDGITYRTIFEMAKRQGVVVIPMPEMPAPVEVDYASLMAQAEEGATIDELDGARLRVLEEVPIDPRLLTPPGMLGEITRYINETARKSQPQFAVQGAIAYCCTVLGRRFMTTSMNWPSLYLLNVGKSSSGKEWAKTVVEMILEEAGLAHLIGPSSYTSASGVLSSLHDQPNHLTVIDEFHRQLEMASVKGNANIQGMIKTLIEVWGRNNGTLRPQGFSTFGLGSKDKKTLTERSVRNPAISLMAMAVPDFWEKVGSRAARDGFLNRFIIVESDIGRQVGNHKSVPAVPANIIEWTKNIRARYTSTVCPDTNPSLPPEPVLVPITEKAHALFREFEYECNGLMDKYEEFGLAEMFGRTNEASMKLALVLALARNDYAVQEQDAEWAILYTKTYSHQTVLRLIATVADGQFEAAKKQVSTYLASCGADGSTVTMIDRRCGHFRNMNKRQQIELLSSLEYLGQVRLVKVKQDGVRGRPSERWIAITSED
jgi:hypothetical protein